MSFNFSPEAFERPRRTISAAGVMLEHAPAIADACQEAGDGETVVAYVTPALAFGGIWIIATRDLAEHLSGTDDGRWELVFAAQESAAGIRARCDTMLRLARRQLEALERWKSRHA